MRLPISWVIDRGVAICLMAMTWALSGNALAQQTSQQTPHQPLASSPQLPAAMKNQQSQAESGLENPWDVRKTVADVLQQSGQLRPLLPKLTPQQWYDTKGAPSTYIIQWQTAQRQLNDVRYAAGQLNAKTDSLSVALDTYFRLEALETTTRSLYEGAQKYADRNLAEQLNNYLAHSFNSRERLRDYLRELSTSTEQNFKIADEEAQSCRADLSKLQGLSKKTKK